MLVKIMVTTQSMQGVIKCGVFKVYPTLNGNYNNKYHKHKIVIIVTLSCDDVWLSYPLSRRKTYTKATQYGLDTKI